jgi:hypothetical protein
MINYVGKDPVLIRLLIEYLSLVELFIMLKFQNEADFNRNLLKFALKTIIKTFQASKREHDVASGIVKADIREERH